MEQTENMETSSSRDFVGSKHPQTKISNPHTRSGSNIWTIITIIGFIVLLGVGAYYFFFQREVQTPKTPQEVVANMMQNTKNLERYAFDIDFTFDFPQEYLSGLSDLGIQGGQMNAEFIGQVDESDPEEIKLDTRIQLDSTTQGRTDNIVTLGLRVIGDQSYLNVLDIMPIGFIDLSVLKNRWIVMDSSNLGDFGLEVETQGYAEFERMLDALIGKREFFAISEVLEPVEQESMMMHHYKLTVNKQDMLGLMQDLHAQDEEFVTANDIETMRQLLADITFSDIDVLIGMQDEYLYAFAIDIMHKDPEVPTISIKSGFSQFNEQFSIQIPPNAMNLQELMGEFMGQFEMMEMQEDVMMMEKESMMQGDAMMMEEESFMMKEQ